MDLWQLSIFCKVVELKSFSRAGDKVHLSQPTVSSHIKDLEDHFGCRLVDRMARGVAPTKAGELLYDYARDLLRIRDEAEIAMAEFQGKMKGRLTLGGSTIPGGYILPKIIGRFVARFPGVRIALRIGDTAEIIRETLSGRVELGVVGSRTGERELVQEKLIEDQMRLIAPADHTWAGKMSVAPDALVKEPFIIREKGSGTLKSIQENLSRIGLSVGDLNVIAEMGSTGAVCQGIKNGLGVSILSAVAAAEDIASGALRAFDVEGLDLRRCFYLTLHRSRSASPICREFTDFLRQHFQVDHAPSTDG